MKMFGKGYMVDYCISLFQKEQEEKCSRDFYIKTLSYIAQGVHFISNNTASMTVLADGIDAKVLKDFAEYIEDKPKDERTTEEKIDDIINLCGLGGE